MVSVRKATQNIHQPKNFPKTQSKASDLQHRTTPDMRDGRSSIRKAPYKEHKAPSKVACTDDADSFGDKAFDM